MYHRLSEDNIAELRSRYEKVQEYMVAYNAISVVSEHYNDLSPEEIWDEALKVVDEISKSNIREWKVDKVYSQLKRKYNAFVDEQGNKETRTAKQQEKTATMVLFDVVLMLVLAQKVEAENIKEHPYFQFMTTILGYIGESILFEAMLAVTKKAEEDVEKMTGRELAQTDYMEGAPEPAKQEDDQDNKLADDKVRRAKLKKVKAELEYQLGKKFKGGSQWFYVYKMMAEMNVYADKSYKVFEADMTAIDEKVNTNTFTRKYGQIKENTRYPNWKVAPGGKQSTLDEGKKIAGIAFDVLYL